MNKAKILNERACILQKELTYVIGCEHASYEISANLLEYGNLDSFVHTWGDIADYLTDYYPFSSSYDKGNAYALMITQVVFNTVKYN